jgi:hypothetical protein
MTLGLMIAGFVAAANPGRVASAVAQQRPRRRAVAVALAAGAALVLVATLLADSLLDALDVSPESFRVAAGIVLAATGVRRLVWPRFTGPFVAILVTPDLAYLALSLGADGHEGKALVAAAIGLASAGAVALLRRPLPGEPLTPFLAAVEVLVGVVLVVTGVRDI